MALIIIWCALDFLGLTAQATTWRRYAAAGKGISCSSSDSGLAVLLDIRSWSL